MNGPTASSPSASSILMLYCAGFMTIFFHDRLLHLVYAALGTLVFSLYLVFDTQLILGGKHKKYQFSIDDYVFAALNVS